MNHLMRRHGMTRIPVPSAQFISAADSLFEVPEMSESDDSFSLRLAPEPRKTKYRCSSWPQPYL